MNQNLLPIFLIGFYLTLVNNSIFANDKSNKNSASQGTCYTWSEGDAQHLDSCVESTLQDCSKGKKSISKNKTSFQNYKGKLFQDPENVSSVYEFKNESAESCKKEIVKSARESELTMCDNFSYAVYSENLKVGDKAFIYGKSVVVREKDSVKSKKLINAEDRSEVKIIEKSKQRSTAAKYPAYWFKVSIDNKTGWVYGQFLHPDPKSETEFIQ